MGKKTEIWLDEEEIDSLLQGTTLWTDVASRRAPSSLPLKIRRLGEPLPSNHHADAGDALREEEKTILSVGTTGKMSWLLAAVAVLTLGSWCYFVFIT